MAVRACSAPRQALWVIVPGLAAAGRVAAMALCASRSARRLLRAVVAAGIVALAGCGDAPLPVTQPEPMPGPTPFEYPVALWDQRVTGETLLLVHVSMHGVVDSVTVFNGSGHAEFDEAALNGARKLRFVPGRKGEQPIGMWTKIPVRFNFDTTASGPLGTGPQP